MRRKVRQQFLLFIDLGLIAIATVLALVLRDNLVFSLVRLNAILPYLGITLVTAAVVLPTSGVHRSIWRFSAMTDYLRVLVSVVIIVIAAVAVDFQLTRLEGVARALPVIQGMLMAFMLIGVRVAMRLRHAHRHLQPVAPPASSAQETVLVVGVNTITELFLRSVAEFAPERVKIAGIVGRSERHSGRLLQQHQVLGVPEEIEGILKTLEVHGVAVGRIVVTSAFSELSLAAQQALLDVKKTSDIQLDFFAERIGLDRRSEGLPAPIEDGPSNDGDLSLMFSAVELESMARRAYWHGKRAIDVSVAALLLVLMSPLVVLVGLIVVLDVGLPAVFWQQRPGLRGRPFKLYKFRTMRNAHDNHGERIPDDLRLSPVGRFLRRTRLDELPQFYNILIGEMSFVGPRPLLPIDQSAAFAARLLVRPGLTGWAQVTGGRAISAHDKAVLDVWYVCNASLWLDIKILGRTLPMLVMGERADAETVREAWDELAGSRVASGPSEIALQTSAATPGGGRQHAA